MSVFETFSMALSNIWASKMRTFLTMIGIIIGIVAVIVIVGLGNGLQAYIEDTFTSMGANNLTVVITGRGASSKTMTDDQVYEILFDNPDTLSMMSPTVSVTNPVKIGTETLESTSVTGGSEQYMDIKDYDIGQGRPLVYGDMVSRSDVCVVGEYISREFFDGNALGQEIKIGSSFFEIVGVIDVLEEDNVDEGGSDDVVVIPYTTASRLTMSPVYSYTIALVDEETIDQCERIIESALYDHFGDEDAYQVINLSTLVSTMQDMTGVMITVLAAIAAISLVVGGIGIMNIMLVSVTERTREIGIRKSLGAKERYIMRQFIVEAATTSALGGAIGIGLGVGSCSLATFILHETGMNTLSVIPSSDAILLAFGVSVGIGILFGYLPAKKASRLNPIDALKYE